MSTQILYGKPCVENMSQEIVSLSNKRISKKLVTVGFCDDKWQQYTNSLQKSATRFGVEFDNLILSDAISPDEFFEFVQNVCKDESVTGIMLQQPLPLQFRDAVKYIDVNKDVDCLNPLSVAKLYNGESGFRPATPSAVLYLLDFYGIELCGKNVVIIGRGNAVGKPLALMMLQRNATVTVCHTKTVNLSKICRNADIIISACGLSGLVTSDFVCEHTIVIDVGLSFVNGKTHGDVDESVYDRCSAVSPVPGGIGPVTRAALFINLLKTIS